MDRTLGENYITEDGKRQFTDGPPGTTVDADFMNQVQEEIVGAIVAAGMVPSRIDRTQLRQAIAILGGANTIITANWFEQSNPKNFDLNSIVRGVTSRPAWCAVGVADGGDAYIVTSLDGVTYTERANPKNFALNKVIVCTDLVYMIAVGVADGTDAYIVKNPNGDGQVWVELANPKNVTLNSIAYSMQRGIFVAVGESDGVDSYIVTSPNNPNNFTEQASPQNIALNDVCYSTLLDMFVAVGDSGFVTISTDGGSTWQDKTISGTTHLNSVCWNEELSLFVAVGETGIIYSSTDGENWTARQDFSILDYATSLNSVHAFGNKQLGIQFLAVGDNNWFGPQMLTSQDGLSWRKVLSPKGFNLYGIYDDSEKVICVGAADGTDALIIKSLSI